MIITTQQSILDNAIAPNTNLVDYSVVSEFTAPSSYRNFSIKYVIEGTEMYYANGNKYFVESKQYFTANRFCEGYVEVKSKKPVKGICIELSPELLSEVTAGHIRPDTPVFDLDLDTFFNSNSFLENKYEAKNTAVGKFMLELDYTMSNSVVKRMKFNSDFYFTLAEKIVEDNIPVCAKLQKVNAVKNNTKKDLLRKLLEAKKYMENHFNSAVNIAEIARFSGISEYHFFRLFKEIFGYTPHQYLILQRLSYARNVLEKGTQNISLLALETGFSDVHSFSKSFKKHFGVSPSHLHRK